MRPDNFRPALLLLFILYQRATRAGDRLRSVLCWTGSLSNVFDRVFVKARS
jgi:lipoprotein signal peptidase